MIDNITRESFEELIQQKNKEILSEKGKSRISISKIKENVSEQFDKEGVAQKTYDKNYDNPDSEYYHMTKDEIIQEWEKRGAVSCQYGNNVDSYMELRFNSADDLEIEMFRMQCNADYDERMKLLLKGEDEVLARFDKAGIRFIAREMPLFYTSPSGVYANGRFDAIFYDEKRGKIMVVDWKNSKDIALSNRFQKLQGPLNKYDQCDGNLFTLQVHFYKTALINTYHVTDNPDDIEVYIIQFTGKESPKYNILKENFVYDKSLVDNAMTFADKMINLQRMIAERKNGK